MVRFGSGRRATKSASGAPTRRAPAVAAVAETSDRSAGVSQRGRAAYSSDRHQSAKRRIPSSIDTLGA